ncbi:MAG TPA: sulfatase-like hydrolase/transferase [Verrucomicrobiae bacterium]|nr:sulfatase-like hydrolase/transferase [Verrucomicrobiae bacterium]
MRRKLPLLLLSGLMGALLRPVAAAENSPAPKPNIVVILIDDMGYGDIQPFGCTNCVTPNLDRMASEGMKLTSFYAAPVCSASRAQIQTGCYAPRVSIPGVLPPDSKVGLNPQEHTERCRKERCRSMVLTYFYLRLNTSSNNAESFLNQFNFTLALHHAAECFKIA